MSDGKSASDLIKKQVNALPKAPQYIQRDFKKFTEFANVIAGLLAASVESKATADNRKKLNAAKKELKDAEIALGTANRALEDARKNVAEKTGNITGARAQLNQEIQLQLNSFNAANGKAGELEIAAGNLVALLKGKTEEPEKKLSKAIFNSWVQIATAVKSVDAPKLEVN